MKRKKGALPGRYVPAHMRKHPLRAGEYVDVSEYQEHVEAPQTKTIEVPRQGELNLEQFDTLKKNEPREQSHASTAYVSVTTSDSAKAVTTFPNESENHPIL